ncbi:MAG: NADH-quinone oxidoreductase subunit B family protein [Ferrimicrobium sp.]|uniref:4Fe-4S dicluster domain-containing protein n=1 Tax=Ferrimicrobium acidiphilum TaxID=121039 RepID=A0ABV3XZC7_9ACTN|nr:4Fe-4S dicluster domain-containing protein [Ferrimicrobium sp.]
MPLWTYRGLKAGVKTTPWPLDEVVGASGLPEPITDACPDGCEQCVTSCPTSAITHDGALTLDQGACVGCNLCVEVCPSGVLKLSSRPTQAAAGRDTLIRRFGVEEASPTKLRPEGDARRMRKSLFVRHVDAGSCNGCESEIGALDNPYYNLHRFGIFFTPSPRFADVLLVTGPVTNPMHEPLKATYEAMPRPNFVVATGVCAISGGTNGGGYSARQGIGDVLPVDLWVPGCPPHPVVLIEALLALIGRER